MTQRTVMIGACALLVLLNALLSVSALIAVVYQGTDTIHGVVLAMALFGAYMFGHATLIFIRRGPA